MKNTKREFSLYSFYDHTNIQKHLEAMAARGWILEKMGNFGWVYRRTEPKSLHFAVTYFPNASEFDAAPGEGQQTFQDYCAEAGWQPVARWAQMQIFCNEAEDPVPIETDAAVQVNTIHSAMKRNYLIGQAVMAALGLLQLGMNLSDLFKHPTDTLANPSFFFLVFVWTLVIVQCGVEAFSYLLWYRRAKRAAELNGSFTPTRGHRGFQAVCLAVLIPCVFLWFFSLGGKMAIAGIGCLLLTLLLQLTVNGIKQLMKRTGCSTAVNRAVTLISSFVLAFALIGGMTYYTVRLVRDRPSQETYTYQGGEYDIHPIALPLTLENLTGESYEHVSRNLIETQTYFLTRQSCREVVGQPQKQITLTYTVTDIRRPWLRDTVIRDYLENTDLVGRIGTHTITFHRSWEPEDPTAWGADAAYRRYRGSDHAPSSDFLLLYGDRIVEFEPNRELTAAQRAIVGEALRPSA